MKSIVSDKKTQTTKDMNLNEILSSKSKTKIHKRSKSSTSIIIYYIYIDVCR